jgi:hypothetical protein
MLRNTISRDVDMVLGKQSSSSSAIKSAVHTLNRMRCLACIKRDKTSSPSSQDFLVHDIHSVVSLTTGPQTLPK